MSIPSRTIVGADECQADSLWAECLPLCCTGKLGLEVLDLCLALA